MPHPPPSDGRAAVWPLLSVPWPSPHPGVSSRSFSLVFSSPTTTNSLGSSSFLSFPASHPLFSYSFSTSLFHRSLSLDLSPWLSFSFCLSLSLNFPHCLSDSPQQPGTPASSPLPSSLFPTHTADIRWAGECREDAEWVGGGGGEAAKWASSLHPPRLCC